MITISELTSLGTKVMRLSSEYDGLVYIDIGDCFIHCVARIDDDGDLILTPTPIEGGA